MKKYMILYSEKGRITDVSYKANSLKDIIKKFHKYHPRKHIKRVFKISGRKAKEI